MKRHIFSYVAFAAFVALGCGDDTSKSKVDSVTPRDMGMDTNSDRDAMPGPDLRTGDMAETDQNEMGGGATIEIYFAGDLEPKTFDDAYSGQTPKEYEIALSKYQVQTSLDDPAPVPCFEHDQPRIANMLEDNLMGTCRVSEIPTNSYTHGRTRVDWVRITIEGTLHFNGDFAGDFTFFRAYSDTTYEGETYAAGEGWIEYRGAVDRRIPFDFGETVPTAPGTKAETIEGEFWFTFPYGRPLPIVQSAEGEFWSRLHWEIYESFRWEDRSMGLYTDGEWDVDGMNAAQTEAVHSFGVSGAYVTSSID